MIDLDAVLEGSSKDIAATITKAYRETEKTLLTRFKAYMASTDSSWKNKPITANERADLTKVIQDSGRAYRLLENKRYAIIPPKRAFDDAQKRLLADAKKEMSRLEYARKFIAAEGRKLGLELYKEVPSTLADLSRYGWTEDAFAAAKKAGGQFSDFATPPENKIRQLINKRDINNNTVQSYINKITKGWSQELTDTIINHTIKGSTYDAMAQELEAKNLTTRRKAQLLVETEGNRAFNSAKLEYQKRNPFVKGYIFMATLDSRTTDICRKHDGKYFPIEDAKQGVNYPPLHIRCRSTVKDVLIDEDEINILKKTRRVGYDKAKAEFVEMPKGMTYKDYIAQHGLSVANLERRQSEGRQVIRLRKAAASSAFVVDAFASILYPDEKLSVARPAIRALMKTDPELLETFRSRGIKISAIADPVKMKKRLERRLIFDEAIRKTGRSDAPLRAKVVQALRPDLVKKYASAAKTDDEIYEKLILAHRGKQFTLSETDPLKACFEDWEARAFAKQRPKDGTAKTVLQAKAEINAKVADPLAHITDKEAEKKAKQIQSQLAEQIARGYEIRKKLTQSDLTDVLKSGEIKNQFETGRSGGMYNQSRRNRVGQSLYDLPEYSSLPPQEKEKYGYIYYPGQDNKKAFRRYGYGNYEIRFKPHIANRTTITYGDTLDLSYADEGAKPLPLSKGVPQISRRALYRADYENDLASLYTEAQISGRITVEDIDAIFIDKEDVQRLAILRGKTTTQLKELQPYSYDFWEGLLNAEKAGIQIKALN